MSTINFEIVQTHVIIAIPYTFYRNSRCLADSWIPPHLPPSMAADSMEIDDSLYR